MPPITTPTISKTMTSANSGSVTEAAGCCRIERIERNRHDLAVGDREGDEDDAERHEDKRRNDLAEQTSGRSQCAGQPALGRLSRSRISLPVLKNGTHF